MQINKVKKTWWILSKYKGMLDGKAQHSPYLSVTKTRPVRDAEDLLYFLSDGYQVTLTEEDILNDSRLNMPNLKPATVASVVHDMYFPNAEECLINSDEDCFLLTDDHGKLIHSTITVFLKKEQVLDLTKKDRARIDKREALKTNQKLVKTFALGSIGEVLAKYGMEIRFNSVKFRDSTTLKKFVIQALEQTVVKELNELGLDVKLNKRFQKLTSKSTLIELEKILLKQQ